MGFHPFNAARPPEHQAARGARLGLCLVLALGLMDGAHAEGQVPPSQPTPTTDVVASVNGQPIRNAELQIMTGQILAVANPTRRADITNAEHAARERLIRMAALAQEALRLGLDRDADVQGIVAYQKTMALADAYVKHGLRQKPVTDAMVEEEYRRGMIGGKSGEYHLRHIIVADEGRAKEIIASLDKGDDFGTLAKLHSGDPNVARTSGDLGWLKLHNLEDFRFVDAVLKLEPGHYTPAPVLSMSGWHVIQLVEKPRLADASAPFAELPAATRTKIRKRATQRAIAALEADAFTKATITRSEMHAPETGE